MARLRVGVLMGGLSIEREVSLSSGRMVCSHMDPLRFDVVPLFHSVDNKLYVLPWHLLRCGGTTELVGRLDEAEVVSWDQLRDLVDLVFIAQHGRFAEDGALQGFLEVLGVPYCGPSILAGALSMDKACQKVFFQTRGVDVARGIAVLPDEIANLGNCNIGARLEQAGINFPCVIKPACEGSSLGVSVVESIEGLGDAVRVACQVAPGIRQVALIEEKLAGMEFTCVVLTDPKTGKLAPQMPIEVTHQDDIYDYDQKYLRHGAHHIPPRHNAHTIERIQEACVRAMEALGATWMARVDGFLTDDGRVVVMEVNTFTGMTPTSFLFSSGAACGMRPSDVINHLIDTKLCESGMDEGYQERKVRVAVLLGGDADQEASLASGKSVIEKLSPTKYEAIPIFVSASMDLFRVGYSSLVQESVDQIAECVDQNMKLAWSDLPKLADFVFIALHGGKAQSGAVQGALEMLGMPYNGSGILTAALCGDKHRVLEFLKTQGFKVDADGDSGTMLTAVVVGNEDLRIFLDGKVLEREVHRFVCEMVGRAYRELGCRGGVTISCTYQVGGDGEQLLSVCKVNVLPPLVDEGVVIRQAAQAGLKPMELIDQLVQLGIEEHKGQPTCREKEIQSC